ncbi:MAG: hypothetical protein BBJ60_06270 [Desulfobacterales bacterium S7086C20]|nr:MAG: hypothetical protein BBJ60_06270 [Desulfobacterales bacterium S7086C20]
MLRSNVEELLKQCTSRFVKSQIMPQARKWDENKQYPLENMKKFAELGLLGLRIPKKYGGSGRGLLDAVIVLEQIAKADASTAVNLHVQLNASPLFVMLYSGEEVKRKLLPALVSGKALFSMAQTEPEVGSNLTELRTLARVEGSYYVVNGTKTMITMGSIAHVHLVYLRFDDDNSIGCLLLEKETKGFSVGKSENFLGLRGLGSTELVFQDCRVPKENLLLKGPGSLRKMLTLFNGTRVGLASISLGIAGAAFEEALKYSKLRTISGKPLIAFQGLQWKLADMAITLEAMKHLVYSAAKDTKLNGFPDQFTSSAARIFSSEGAIKIANTALDIFGGYGYSKEFPMERYLREAKGMTFVGGTIDVLRNAIGSYLSKKNM